MDTTDDGRRTGRRLTALLGAVALAACGTAGGGAPSTTAGTTSAGNTTSAPPAATRPLTSSPRATTSAPSAPPGTTSDGGGDAAASRCRASALAVSLKSGEAAAGSTVRALVFTNTSTATCSLQGFPGVSYVTGSSGKQVGAAAGRSGPRGTVVILRPGQQASATVRVANVHDFDPVACRVTPVRGFRVYPPGSTAALFVPAAGTGCAGSVPAAQLLVQAVRPAS